MLASLLLAPLSFLIWISLRLPWWPAGVIKLHPTVLCMEERGEHFSFPACRCRSPHEACRRYVKSRLSGECGEILRTYGQARRIPRSKPWMTFLWNIGKASTEDRMAWGWDTSWSTVLGEQGVKPVCVYFVQSNYFVSMDRCVSWPGIHPPPLGHVQRGQCSVTK